MTGHGDSTERSFSTHPVPKAVRDPERIFVESVSDSKVVLDARSMHYHTLNQSAYDVWDLCDGQRSLEDIHDALSARGKEIPDEAIALAVAQLGESELLEAEMAIGESRIHRRRVFKLAAAGLIGAGALPLIESITVPHASAATSVSGSCCEKCTVTGCVGVNVGLLSLFCTGTVDVCLDLFLGNQIAAVTACIGATCFL